MRNLAIGSLVALLSIHLTGCRKGSHAKDQADSQSWSAKATAEAVGVDTCDDWKRKYARCIDEKAPAESRDRMREAFERATAGWKQLATTPTGRKALDTACKDMMDTTRRATASMGCDL